MARVAKAIELSSGRCKREHGETVGMQEKVQLIYSMGKPLVNKTVEAAVGGTVLHTDVGQEQGRELTQAENAELSVLMTHVKWGNFVIMLEELQKDTDTNTLDFVEMQLASGLPIVRRQLFCLVKVKGSPHMRFLLNHRMARKGSIRVLQQYLGKVLAKMDTGVMPHGMEMYLVPSWLVHALIGGRLSDINWERLLVELAEAKGAPMEEIQAKEYIKDVNMYCFEDILDDVSEIGSTVLAAWGWDDPQDTVNKGCSFANIVKAHKQGLKVVKGVKGEPSHNWLRNKRYGVFPRLHRALEDAQENYVQLMEQTPAQNLIEGSDTEMIRTFTPLLPPKSEYFEMGVFAEKERLKLAERRLDHPSLYNEERGKDSLSNAQSAASGYGSLSHAEGSSSYTNGECYSYNDHIKSEVTLGM